MKLYRNAIILVVVVALLVGAYFLFSNMKKEEGDTTDTASSTIKLIDFSTTDVTDVTLKNQEGTFVITHKDTDWVLVSPTDLKADSSVLSSIAINASSVSASKLVEENAQDLSKYGLDKSPVVVTVKKKDGTEKSLEIGDLTPIKSGYYVKLTGENKVYVLDEYSAESLLTKRNGMKSKELFTGITSDMFNRLEMDRKNEVVFSAEADAKNSGSWNMTKPIRGSANTSALAPMFEALAGTKVSEYIEENPADLSKYGLDVPSFTFDFGTTTAGAFKLKLGDEQTKGSTMYAMLEGRNEVFTIDSSAYTFLDKPLKEIVDLFAYIVNIDQVTKIELTMGGKTDVMTLDVYKDAEGKSDADKDKFTFNGKDATGKNEDDKQPFREFYQSLIGISLDEVDLSEAQPADANPDITIQYTLKSGSMKVELVSKDADYYYVFRNGEYANILVKKTKEDFGVVGMKNSYKKMVDFLAKQ
jgi:hypothetical protein